MEKILKESTLESSLPPTDGSKPDYSLGAKLRQIRKALSLSLTAVGEGTGLSPSFVSMVENGKSDITIRRLIRLVEFYGISVTDVLETKSAIDSHIIRESERPHVSSPTEGIDVYLLARETDRSMMPQLLDIKPGASLAEPGSHPGEEWIYVLSGELVLDFDGAPSRVLKAGDSAYYDATQLHQFTNPSDRITVRLICVDTPPNM